MSVRMLLSAASEICGLLRSADSLAWSYRARKRPPLPGCPHARCSHCLRYALAWRERVLAVIARASRRPVPPSLFG